MILDCGGGTVDATFIKLKDSKKLIDILPRDGGKDFGSLMIDDEYYTMLNDLFGSHFIESFKKQLCDINCIITLCIL